MDFILTAGGVTFHHGCNFHYAAANRTDPAHAAAVEPIYESYFDAQRALMAGLINRIVVPEDLEPVALSYARALASKPPQAVRLARRLMRGDRREVVNRISQEANSFAELLHSPAAHDALLDFLEGGTR